MKAYLIDAENVSPHNFFKNYKFKKEEKNIFYIVEIHTYTLIRVV